MKLTVHEGLLIGIGEGGGSHLPPNYPVWKGVHAVAISQLPRNLRLCKGPSSDTSDFFCNFIFNGSRTILCKLKSSRCFCNSYFSKSVVYILSILIWYPPNLLHKSHLRMAVFFFPLEFPTRNQELLSETNGKFIS